MILHGGGIANAACIPRNTNFHHSFSQRAKTNLNHRYEYQAAYSFSLTLTHGYRRLTVMILSSLEGRDESAGEQRAAMVGGGYDSLGTP